MEVPTGKRGERHRLDVVGRSEPDVVDVIRPGVAKIERTIPGLRQPRMGVRWAALEQAGLVRGRDDPEGSRRQEWPDQGDHPRVGRELRGLFGGGRRAKPFVMRHDRQRRPIDAVAGIDVGDRQLDRLADRIPVLSLGARQGHLQRDLPLHSRQARRSLRHPDHGAQRNQADDRTPEPPASSPVRRPGSAPIAGCLSGLLGNDERG